MRHPRWLAVWLLMAACGYEELPALSGVDAGDDASGDGASIDGPPRPPQYTSCVGLAMKCGKSGGENCCDPAMTIPGGTFYRGYDDAPSGYDNTDAPATVSAFVLDKYEVSVGRFRAFVNVGKGTQASPPAAGSGAHPILPGSGWDSSWNTTLATTTSMLRTRLNCDATYQTWSDVPGIDDKPINCVNWYEAMAFCIWDGGYLPTEAEWNLAAAGGSEQRAFPWSNPASSTIIDCTYANYYINSPAGTHCTATSGAANRVGSESPMGDGRWGQSDLAGNVEEWVFDGYDGTSNYPLPCVDCAIPRGSGAGAWTRGGHFGSVALAVRTGYRANQGSTDRTITFGFRCARLP